MHLMTSQAILRARNSGLYSHRPNKNPGKKHFKRITIEQSRHAAVVLSSVGGHVKSNSFQKRLESPQNNSKAGLTIWSCYVNL